MPHSPTKTVCSYRLLPFSIPGREQSGANPPQTRINPGFFKTFRTLPQQHSFNEWYIRDSSRKVRAVLRAKAERGERLGTRAPYGYRKDENDKKHLVIDEEAAATVRRIFAMCAAGNGPMRIAKELQNDQILCPAVYAYQKYGHTHIRLNLERPYHWSGDSIRAILENEVYLGNTINLRYSTKSYKDKRKIERPREECLVFENTHPALVTKDIWDIVQRVRQNKRRRNNFDEQNKYSGLVVCADCGRTMVLHRTRLKGPAGNNFTCYTYRRLGTEGCTAHYIRECVLDDIILEDLRQVTAMAREHTSEFAEYIGSKHSTEIQREIRRLEKELTTVRKRSAELDVIFKKLYEDRVLGHISVEQFQTLSSGYTEEQTALKRGIEEKESAIRKLKESVSNTAHFIDKAKKHTDITELTPELLRMFIKKIVVHEKSVKYSKVAEQTVEIHYTDIGYIDEAVPQSKENPRQEISA